MKVKNPEIHHVVQQTLLYLEHLGRLNVDECENWNITNEDDYEEFVAEIEDYLYA